MVFKAQGRGLLAGNALLHDYSLVLFKTMSIEVDVFIHFYSFSFCYLPVCVQYISPIFTRFCWTKFPQMLHTISMPIKMQYSSFLFSGTFSGGAGSRGKTLFFVQADKNTERSQTRMMLEIIELQKKKILCQHCCNIYCWVTILRFSTLFEIISIIGLKVFLLNFFKLYLLFKIVFS